MAGNVRRICAAALLGLALCWGQAPAALAEEGGAQAAALGAAEGELGYPVAPGGEVRSENDLVLALNAENCRKVGEGHYALERDVQTSGQIIIAEGSWDLDLGGHTISRLEEGGGPVFGVRTGAALSVSNGTVTGGRVSGEGAGGGFNVYGELSLDAVSVEGNRAASIGGGVHVADGARVSLGGGTSITGNEAPWGGGVYVAPGGSLSAGGSVTVEGNGGSGAPDTNVYLAGGAVIEVASPLGGSRVGLTSESAIATAGYAEKNPDANPASHFFADSDAATMALRDGEARVAYPYIERAWDEGSGQVTDTEGLLDDGYVLLRACERSGDDVWVGDTWVVVDRDVEIEGRLFCKYDTRLLLCDGRTLRVGQGVVCDVGKSETEPNRLTVHGQAGDSGRLVSTGDSNTAGIGGADETPAGVITIHGGAIEATGDPDAAGIGGGYKGDGGTITIYGGTIRAAGKHSEFNPGAGAGIGGGDCGATGTITIYGGKIEAIGVDEAAAIGSGDEPEGPDGTITIYGGDITATAGVGDKGEEGHDSWVRGGAAGIGGGDAASGGTITIYGGTIKATGGQDAAGIGGGEGGNGGTISIYGGEVTARSYDSDMAGGGAAIGGGEDGSSGTIAIYGGTVEAKADFEGFDNEGEWCPGIGAGHNGMFESVSIHGGTVTAEGSMNEGPGIGGACKDGSQTLIDGGTVFATGHDGAPGIGFIGGGKGSITIAAGTVVATGDKGGAGIGGSYEAGAGTITIIGGDVTATSRTTDDRNGAGIGCGAACTEGGGSIRITGGNVYADGGSWGAGIGTGGDGDDDDDGYLRASVSIEGGTVEAIGRAGAAIGAGYGGTLHAGQGKVEISGGDVTLRTERGDGRSAAAIGAGADGGACEHGTISLTDGTVRATSQNATAMVGPLAGVGRPLDLGYMKVSYSLQESGDYAVAAHDERVDLCAGRAGQVLRLLVEPCAKHKWDVTLGLCKLCGCPYKPRGDEPLATEEMFRLYNPNSGEHFYTSDAGERDGLVGLGWRDEGVAWDAPAEEGDPVFRLYNANGGEHHYTLDFAECDALVNLGWSYEGVGWLSDADGSVAVLREYNPNAFSCNHNYTTDRAEHDQLVSLGWRDEGVAWYGATPGK